MANVNMSGVNGFDNNHFVQTFSNVIEKCTEAAVEVAKKRPFENSAALCEAFAKYLDDLTETEKVAILKCIPDLAGRLAREGKLSKESTAEQSSAGLDHLTEEQKKSIDYNNERYKAKFGFPYVICARQNSIQSIMDGLQRRYNNTREQEITTGIGEAKKICKLRIMDIVKDLSEKSILDEPNRNNAPSPASPLKKFLDFIDTHLM